MHTATWLLWLLAALTALTLISNPLYLLLIALATALVFAACRNDSPLARSYGLLLRVGGLLFVGYMLFALITVGGMAGTTVLLRLPEIRLPLWLGGLVLGGAITAEGLVWAAVRGLRIWVLLAVFGAFNALVDHYRLLRLAPRMLFHAGLAVTIAISFVPSLVRSTGEIVEAQRARGHRFRGMRSWLALLAPLLAGSLERSLQLAESLDARGYGRTIGVRDRRLALLTPLALCLIAGALFAWFYYGDGPQRVFAISVGTGGGLLLGIVTIVQGRQLKRSVYRRERWRRGDSVTALAAVALILILATFAAQQAGTLGYTPFPTISAPGFDMLIGGSLLLLAVPAFVEKSGVRSQNDRRRGDRVTG
jgi:energy-coupling factor transport system permease protein